MRPQFSEFTYGFALVHELMNSGLYWSGVPEFPSLQRERDLGWDVRVPLLGIPVFLQFKLSMHLDSPLAAQYSFFRGPYFRFSIYSQRVSKQHELLVKLSRTELVRYAASGFLTDRDLGRHVAAGRVAQHSAWVDPLRIGSFNDEDPHYFSFESPASRRVLVSSDPREMDLDISWEGLMGQTQREPIEITPAFLLALERRVDRVVSGGQHDPDGESDRATILRRLGDLARVHLGAEVFILGTDPQ